jgi:hypothetical protein
LKLANLPPQPERSSGYFLFLKLRFGPVVFKLSKLRLCNILQTSTVALANARVSSLMYLKVLNIYCLQVLLFILILLSLHLAPSQSNSMQFFSKYSTKVTKTFLSCLYFHDNMFFVNVPYFFVSIFIW